MIAVDTNVLVRLVTRDDPEQFAAARSALESATILLISPTVMLELEWVLRHCYQFGLAEIQETLRRVLGLDKALFHDRRELLQALEWHADGLDFADALHLAMSSGAQELLTFDRQLASRAEALGCRPAVRRPGS